MLDEERSGFFDTLYLVPKDCKLRFLWVFPGRCYLAGTRSCCKQQVAFAVFKTLNRWQTVNDRRKKTTKLDFNVLLFFLISFYVKLSILTYTDTVSLDIYKMYRHFCVCSIKNTLQLSNDGKFRTGSLYR